MRFQQHQIEVTPKGKGTWEITEEVEKIVKRSGIQRGLVNVFLPHTSCSLLLMENAAPAARRDLEAFFDDLVPENRSYEHDDEGPDDMPAHIRMALTRSTETLPIFNGRTQFGTWQGLFLFEHRREPHRRKISVTVFGE